MRGRSEVQDLDAAAGVEADQRCCPRCRDRRDGVKLRTRVYVEGSEVELVRAVEVIVDGIVAEARSEHEHIGTCAANQNVVSATAFDLLRAGGSQHLLIGVVVGRAEDLRDAANVLARHRDPRLARTAG